METETKMKLVTFRLDPAAYKDLQLIAEKEYRSVSEQIRLYVERGLESDVRKV